MTSVEKGISSDVTEPTSSQAKGYDPFTSFSMRDYWTGSLPMTGEDDVTDNLL